MRFFKKLLAKIRGTFFTDCPRCHSWFHGKLEYGIQLKFERQYRLVCHNCAIDHRKLNEKAV